MRARGQRARRGAVTVTYLADGSVPPRVAYAVGKKVGGAVVRNRVRRRLQAAVHDLARDTAGPVRPGAYLVIAGAPAATAPYQELTTMLATALGALAARETP